MITSNLLSFNCFAEGDTKKIVNNRLSPLTTVFASWFQFALHSSPKQGQQYGYLHIFLLQMLGLLFQTSSNGCQLSIAFLQCFDFLFQRFLIILLSFLKKRASIMMMTSLFFYDKTFVETLGQIRSFCLLTINSHHFLAP